MTRRCLSLNDAKPKRLRASEQRPVLARFSRGHSTSHVGRRRGEPMHGMENRVQVPVQAPGPLPPHVIQLALGCGLNRKRHHGGSRSRSRALSRVMTRPSRNPRRAYNADGCEIRPMSLGNMREHGVRSVLAICQEASCGHSGSVNADDLPDDFPEPMWFCACDARCAARAT
jgi:hypothetical protein